MVLTIKIQSRSIQTFLLRHFFTFSDHSSLMPQVTYLTLFQHYHGDKKYPCLVGIGLIHYHKCFKKLIFLCHNHIKAAPAMFISLLWTHLQGKLCRGTMNMTMTQENLPNRILCFKNTCMSILL